ncbi:MAG: DUF808 domain-containing protein [Planctomycetes bacterium]|nr:DUF808 domain-containing protein [Planctomycetota bacterium]
MASGLFVLLDDIASILDDVAALTKVAAKKTSGVLGDDLALNAQQVSGVDANRELPIVWAVAKGSAVNKLILVPSALLLSYLLPWAITPLMILGGGFLCFEGIEKILHKWLHSKSEDEAHHQAHLEVITTPEVDPVGAEKKKIAGAVRTDFILSAEIIVITLDVVADSSPWTKILVLSSIGVLMTVGVYGLVAGIVKLDDLGLWLSKSAGHAKMFGSFLLKASPFLMKGLSIAGTIAMFLVGGGILVHKISWLHEGVHTAIHAVEESLPWLKTPFTMTLEGIVGVLAGCLAVGGVMLIKFLFGKKATS